MMKRNFPASRWACRARRCRAARFLLGRSGLRCVLCASPRRSCGRTGAPLAPPACDAKTLTDCTPNSGDTAWMMTSVALVLLMTVPGLGLFYGGMVRKKNVGDTVMTSFAITCLITILFACVTYSLSFTAGSPYIGGLSRAFLQGIVSDIAKGIGNPNALAPTIPETVYICFQMTFAIITPALIAGAYAERMKFSAMLWFTTLWAILVYAPVAHWVWGPDGMFAAGNSDAMLKVLDFAGGTVVHVNSGTAGLMCAIMLGKRTTTGPAPQHGADLHRRLAAVGRLVRLQCRFGGHGRHAGRHGDDGHPDRDRDGGLDLDVRRMGDARQADRGRHLHRRGGRARRHHAGFRLRRPGRRNGDRRRGRSRMLLCVTALKHMFGYDDALDAFGVHAVGGAVGAVLTGVFAIEQYGGTRRPHRGQFHPGHQPSHRRRHRLRLRRRRVADHPEAGRFDDRVARSKEVEIEGLDIALHGEAVQ